MLITINNSTSVAEIQDHFSTCFPHLRIEFYRGHNMIKKNEPMLPSILLSTVGRSRPIGQMEIKSWHQADKVIAEFKSQFGLLVKIFRSQDGFESELGPHEQLGTQRVAEKK